VKEIAEGVKKRLQHATLFQQLNQETLILQRRLRAGASRCGAESIPEVTVEKKAAVFSFTAALLEAACCRVERAQSRAEANEIFKRKFLSPGSLALPGAAAAAGALRLAATVDRVGASALLDEVFARMGDVVDSENRAAARALVEIA